MKNAIYLDYAAATPLKNEVLESMLPYLKNQFYNPSSSYLAAKKIKDDIEGARAKIAYWLGAKPAEIIFTAGATEANNLAIHGLLKNFPGGNIIASSIEHESILSPVKNYTHALLNVGKTGKVNEDELKSLIDENTILVSIGYANNEIGTIQNLSRISSIINDVREQRRKSNNLMPIFLHTDAAQATPYLDLHTHRLGVDLMTINGSKVYGPKQIGALYVSSRIELQPIIWGGGQEYGLRSGTENVPGIIGLAKALDTAQHERKTEGVRIAKLRDFTQKELINEFPETLINGDQKHRLSNNLNISFPNKDGERILMMCDEQGLQIATGAACSANKQTGSHVLKAIQLKESNANGSIRLSLGYFTDENEAREAVRIIKEVVKAA